MTEQTFSDKKQALQFLTKEYERWDALLSPLDDKQASETTLYDNRTIKDDVAHLWEWQRISVARMRAAIEDQEPEFHWIPDEFAPNVDDLTEEYNQFIYQSNRKRSWIEIYRAWRENFQRFLELSEQVSEATLLEGFPWLGGYPLMAVLEGAYDHHHEDHLPMLLERLNQ